MKTLKQALTITLVVILAITVSACMASNETDEQTTTEVAKTDPTTTEATETSAAETTADASATPTGQPIVTIATKIGDQQLEDMQLLLNPASAPNTVANFVTLANDGYYNGLIFHRIIEDFMVQGGDPTGTGMGGPEYSIYGEFKSNGFDNEISHERGVISMARSQHPNSAGSQFFICHKDASFLDGDYAAFGKLISGETALDALATTKTLQGDRPEVDCVITSITVDLNGYELPEVEKLQ